MTSAKPGTPNTSNPRSPTNPKPEKQEPQTLHPQPLTKTAPLPHKPPPPFPSPSQKEHVAKRRLMDVTDPDTDQPYGSDASGTYTPRTEMKGFVLGLFGV